MFTILLVDDDELLLKSVGDMLEASGYAVLRTTDGSRALGLLKAAAVDLVIADKQMPGMDGLALARQIKERSPDLPVVIMTGYGDLESYLCATGLGVVRYIGKPVGMRELRQIVNAAVSEGPRAQTATDVRATGL